MGSLKGSDATIGYRYSMTLQFGLGRGPIDEIVEIRIGDKRAWPVAEGATGAALTPAPPLNDTGLSQINAYELFGGEKAEGGVQGTIRLFNGHPNQTMPTWIKLLMGGNVPGFRGIASLVFDGMICAMNPYPKQWAVRERRALRGWDGDVWQPALVVIPLSGGAIKAMNPAHILYECCTNRDWGRGLPRAMLDDESWTAAAQTLFNEAFGLCLRWNRSEELGSFIKIVLDHIGGSIYVDRTTGLMKLKLLRSDYDVNTIPHFDYNSGLISIDQEASARDSAINEVVIQFKDPIKNEERSVRVQNLASIQSLGSRNSTKADYSGLPTFDLAMMVANRDLKASTTGLKRFSITLDRRASGVFPGAVFSVSAPEKGITNVVVRAGKVEDSKLSDGSIKVGAIQDVFGLSTASYQIEEPSGWIPPNTSPLVSTQVVLRDVTYQELFKELTPSELALITETSTHVATLAGRPSSLTLSYNIMSRTGVIDFANHGYSNWCPTFILSEDLSFYETDLTFDSAVDFSIIQVGDLLQINNEIVQITAIVSESIVTIKRGCIDTVPVQHELGSIGFVFSDNIGFDTTEYVDGETVDVKIQSVTSSGVLDLTLAPTLEITVAARHAKPYPPGNVRLNGVLVHDVGVVVGDMVFSWSHRDRLLQMDQVVGHLDGNVGPEIGTSYNIRFYDDADELVGAEAGIVTTTYTYSDVDILGNITVEIESERDGLVSHQRHRFTLNRSI